MKKKSYVVLSILLSVLLFLMTGCSGSTQGTSDSKTGGAVTEGAVSGQAAEVKNTSETELVILTESGYVDLIDDERLEAVNSRLAECGCDFRVKLIGYDDLEYDEYQKTIDDRKKNGEPADLIYTGLGDERYPDARTGSYDRNIKAGNLLKLDGYLKSEEGKTLWNQYTQTEWDCADKYGGIYGVYNIKQKNLIIYLMINANIVKEEPDILTDGKPDWEKVRKLVEAHQKEALTGLYFDWDSEDLIGDEERQFVKFGYERPAKGFYTDKEKFINIWADEGVRSFWTNVHELAAEGLVSVDSQAGRQTMDNGDFIAAVGEYYEDAVSEHVYYTDSVGEIPVYRYEVAVPSAPKAINIMTGVASWTKHRKKALQLLTLLNCDETLANLMSYGIEGKDYHLSDGYVTDRVGGNGQCMANLQITYPARAEQKNKREILHKLNERLTVSKFDGFTLDTGKIKNYKKIVKAVDGAYLHFLTDKEKSRDEILQELDAELEKLGIDRAVASCNRQFKAWKKKQK